MQPRSKAGVISDTDNENGELVPSQRRLQRPPDFTGDRLNTFRSILLRHGVPGALLGAIGLLHPDMRALLGDGLVRMSEMPVRYVVIGLVMFAGLTAYAFYIDRKIDVRQLGWIIYLLGVSIWEEWVFRLALPYFAEAQGVDLRVAVVASNLIFGALHYFTLRWKWQWCLGAFVGGMLLSRNFHMHFDLALVIGIHWVATYVNTPRLPGTGRRRGAA